MSQREGKQLTCDRCGKQVFQNCTIEYDEGERIFEDTAADWETVMLYGVKYDFCPKCAQIFRTLCESFLKYTKEKIDET